MGDNFDISKIEWIHQPSLLVMTVATVWLLNIANIYNKYLAEDELA